MSDTIPEKFTVPLVEYTRLAAERDALRSWVRAAPHLPGCMTNARDYVGKREIKCDCGKDDLLEGKR
jgi:hypothetical protein